MPSLAEKLGLPPGVRFDPTPDELIEFYLLPRALGKPPAVQGVIIDEDAAAAASTRHPWKLLTGHRRTDDDEAYFFERTTAAAAARQDRACGKHWTWVSQKRAPDKMTPMCGEQVTWGKNSLNLQRLTDSGRRKKSGSTGWVMHEYIIASPQCPLKICHVAFTGHGQKRQRVPDDDGEAGDEELVPPQHKRVATASCVTTTASDQDLGAHGQALAQNQEQRFFPNYYEASSSAAGSSQEPSFLHPGYPEAGSSQQESFAPLNQELAHDRGCFTNQSQAYHQEQFVNHAGSSVGDACGSDAGSFLDPLYPDAGSSQQEPFAPDQELAQDQECFMNQTQAYYHQEQFVNHAGSCIGAYSALLQASDLGSSQEQPPLGQPLSQEQQLRLQLARLLSGVSSPHIPPIASAGAEAGYHEEHIQTMAPAETSDHESCTTEQPLGNMDQHADFFRDIGGDIDSFCDTTGLADDDIVVDVS
ncbi:hypothetical protein BS78_04G298300 [Paspalum vaginatum]|nr:hypothetical protein BS78_04G298300 [Paspalum vaginatum]